MNILEVPLNEPLQIFPYKEQERRDVYLDLMKKYHPDRNKDKDAAKIAQHISSLYENMQKLSRADNGVWFGDHEVVLVPHSMPARKIIYKGRRKFELGEMVYGDTKLTYIVKKEYKGLFDNALNNVRSFKYASVDMEQEVGRYLPKIVESFETSDGSHVLVLEKTADVLLLQDILDKIGPLDPKHVAWICSRLFNLCCYFNWAGIVNNNFSPMTCWISPEFHTVCIYGWFYGAKEGSPLSILPSRSVKYLQSDIIRSKKASKRSDLALLRVLGRELLGDISGMNIVCPDSMKECLKGITTGEAVKEYSAWKDKILLESFGPRRFTVMDVKPSDIYKEQ